MNLNEEGIRYSIITDKIKRRENNILKAINFLYVLAQTSDGMCRMTCKSFSIERVTRMLKTDLRICKKVSAGLHNLFLTLMADQSFKMSLAISYANAYRHFAGDFQHGVGSAENSIFTLSVQFLNREAFVSEIVNNHDFLGHVSHALEESLISESPLDHNGFVGSFKQECIIFQCRRYILFIGDLKIAFTIPGMSRTFVTICLPSWLRILMHFQYMHPQSRQLTVHIEQENKDWIHAFNLYLALVSLYEYLFNWLENPNSTEEDGVVTDYFEEPEFTDLLSNEYIEKYGDIMYDSFDGFGSPMTSASTLMREVLRAIFIWQYNNFPPKFLVIRSKHCNDDLLIGDPIFYGHHSFHLLLHRFLSFAILECCKYHHHSKMLSNIMKFLALCDQRHLSLLVDAPLRSLILAAHIRNRRWVRNGQVMQEQMMNYSDPPFCKVFKDLDMLMIQFCSLAYGVEKTVVHIIYRFNHLQYADGSEHAYRKGIDVSQTQNDLDEMLQLLILITVELPIKPFNDPAERALMLMRREAIHHLACTPSTYSLLNETLALVPDNGKVKADQTEKMINEIAELRQGSGLDPSQLHLRKESWRFYDPCYPHTSAKDHQQIIERRPKITSSQPMVCRPLECHPVFASLRIQVTCSHTLLSLMRDLVLSYAAERSTSKHLGYGVIKKNWILQCNSSIFTRILHLLTLAIHEIDSDNRIVENMTTLVTVLLKSRILTYEEPIELSEDEGLREFKTLNMDGPSFLCSLIDIYDSFTTNEEANHKFWLEWVLNKISPLDESCTSYINQRMSTRQDENRAKELELKKMKARERSLSMMKKSSEAFQAHLERSGLADEDLEMTQDNEDPDYDEYVNGKKDEVPLCIICQLSNNDTLYYQAFNQSSKVLKERKSELHLDVDEPITVDDNEQPDLHISFCGHAIHSVCFDSYFASTLSRVNYFENILDLKRGQFCCAFCKKLNNFLVPYIPKDSTLKTSCKDSNSETSIINPDNSVDWLNWIESPTFECGGKCVRSSIISADMEEDQSMVAEIADDVEESSSASSTEQRMERPVKGSWFSRFGSISQYWNKIVRRNSNDNDNNETSNADMDNSSSAPLPEEESNMMMTLSSTPPGSPPRQIVSLHDKTDNESKKLLCYRFLRDFCDTINVGLGSNLRDLVSDSHDDGLYYSNKLVKCVDSAISSVAFTLSIDLIEHSSNLESKKFDNKKFMHAVVDTIGETMDVFNIFDTAVENLSKAFNGEKIDTSYEVENGLLISTPLLSRSLFDNVILCLAINMMKQKKRAELAAAIPLDPSIKWLCVAKLIQLLNSMLNRTDLFSVTKTPFIPIDKTDIDSTYKMLQDWSLGVFASQIISKLKNINEQISGLSEAEWMYVLWHWISFLQGVVHVVYRCMPNMLPGQYSTPRIAHLNDVTDEVIQETCRYLGIEMLLFPDVSDSSLSLSNGVQKLIDASITRKQHTTMDLVQSIPQYTTILNIKHLERYPPINRPEIIQLPNVYTQFHSILTSMCPYEFPAVCLSCGAVIDAGGKGLCSLHSEKCGKDSSVFFLLQDCHILLSHRLKCSYFPAPYVDFHGERHRQVRGKPLHLDTNRFNSLYQLWLSHNVPQEVAHNRQNSTRIIIQGYY